MTNVQCFFTQDAGRKTQGQLLSVHYSWVADFLYFAVLPPFFMPQLVLKHSTDPVFLEENFTFYRNLGEADRRKFLHRLIRFVRQKDFMGRGGLKVTPEMEMLVSAAAIQLTFGLEEYLLPHFHTIILYPEAYYSPLDGHYHKGEASGQGIVVFSWKDFQEGYALPADKLNLGLHEWAHALMMENQFGIGRDELFREYFNRFRFESLEAFWRIRSGSTEVFRSYAGVNMGEFFAVSVEVFFEAPEQFQERLPVLFRHMCVLLNQFPFGEPETHLPLPGAEPDPVHDRKGVLNKRMDPQPLKLQYYVYSSAALFIAALLLYGTQGSIALPVVFLCLVVLRFIRKAYLSRNSEFALLLFEDHLSVHGREDDLMATYFYEDLASLDIAEHDNFYRILFVYPQQGRIHAEGFRFRFSEEQVEELRTFMKTRKLPVLYTGI